MKGRLTSGWLALILTLPCFACSSASQHLRDDAEGRAVEESFDFRSLEDDDLTIGYEAGYRAVVPKDIGGSRLAGGMEAGADVVQGWRVQIFTSQDFLEADSVRGLADSLFAEDVYITFDTPNYKIRVGDYLDRDGADKLRQMIVNRGFRTAWVIRGEVIPPWKREQKLEENAPVDTTRESGTPR